MKKILTLLTMALLLPQFTWAHEGHNIKVMGTVAAVSAQELTIKTTTGKSSLVKLDGKTKVLQGKVAKKIADIKVGDRVVVTASDVKGKDGKTTLIAKQVALGAATATSSTTKK